MKTDVCITGAGPAGIFAAIFAARAGVKVLIVERNTSACRKLLRTGRTRCNLTHTGSVQDFIKAYDRCGRFLRHSLYEFSAEDLRQYFADRGLKTKVENSGCVFPVTDRATDVAKVLLDDAEKLSVQFMYGRTVRAVKKEGNGFEVLTDRETISAGAVIITTGGMSWPFTGSTGDGYGFAESFGHNIVQPKAALCPLVVAEEWLSKLQGVAVQRVIIKAKVDNKKFTVDGPLMFTAKGIGGPAVFDLSRLITTYLPSHEAPVSLVIDFLPQLNCELLDGQIIDICSKHPKKAVAAVISQFIAKSLSERFCERLNLPQTFLANQLGKNQRKQLVHMLKALRIFVTAAGGIEQATVTRGGVATNEISPKTMESKLCPGLFFSGEVMDVDGPCGGYNLQIAFSTGRLAGIAAADYCC